MSDREKMIRSPILGSDAELVTVLVFEEKTDHRDMAIYQAYLDGLHNQELANAMNRRYFREATALFSNYLHKVDEGAINITFLSNYTLKANNGITAAIEHSLFIAEASGTQTLRYNNLDMKNEYYITLPSLFKNDTYIERISQEIKRQIAYQMTATPGAVYYTDENAFHEITPTQPFYINNAHNLIIVFDQYTIAPGFMGTPDFLIPTTVISDLLANHLYID